MIRVSQSGYFYTPNHSSSWLQVPEGKWHQEVKGRNFCSSSGGRGGPSQEEVDGNGVGGVQYGRGEIKGEMDERTECDVAVQFITLPSTLQSYIICLAGLSATRAQKDTSISFPLPTFLSYWTYEI